MNRDEKADFSKDAVLLFILAKIDQYKGEKEYFENKYRRDFQEVEQGAHSVKGKEDFQTEQSIGSQRQDELYYEPMEKIIQEFQTRMI